MRTTSWSGCALALLALFLPGASLPHHVVADDIDLARYLDLEGVIERVEWINPHVVIHLSTAGNDGLTQHWQVLADTPNSLLRRGLNRNSFAFMATVQMRVYPAASTPCAATCYAYGYELTDPGNRTHVLLQTLHEFVNQLNLPQ